MDSTRADVRQLRSIALLSGVLVPIAGAGLWLVWHSIPIALTALVIPFALWGLTRVLAPPAQVGRFGGARLVARSPSLAVYADAGNQAHRAHFIFANRTQQPVVFTNVLRIDVVEGRKVISSARWGNLVGESSRRQLGPGDGKTRLVLEGLVYHPDHLEPSMHVISLDPSAFVERPPQPGRKKLKLRIFSDAVESRLGEYKLE